MIVEIGTDHNLFPVWNKKYLSHLNHPIVISSNSKTIMNTIIKCVIIQFKICTKDNGSTHTMEKFSFSFKSLIILHLHRLTIRYPLKCHTLHRAVYGHDENP